MFTLVPLPEKWVCLPSNSAFIIAGRLVLADDFRCRSTTAHALVASLLTESAMRLFNASWHRIHDACRALVQSQTDLSSRSCGAKLCAQKLAVLIFRQLQAEGNERFQLATL